MRKEYLYDTTSDLVRDRLDCLEILLDPLTERFIDDTGLRPGMRCLDLGAGGGSVARWLADRTAPGGDVLAVDLNTDHLVDHPGVTVNRHDINDGMPPGGPFDLIHVRLLLMQLPRRATILAELVDLLAPGGWLVVGDFWFPPLHTLAAPTRSEHDLFDRVQAATHRIAVAEGVDPDWAREVDAHLTEAGLVDVYGEEVAWTVTGGDTGSRLHRNYNRRLEPALIAEGFTSEDLVTYRELMHDPCFRSWFYQFHHTRGQKFG